MTTSVGLSSLNSGTFWSSLRSRDIMGLRRRQEGKQSDLQVLWHHISFSFFPFLSSGFHILCDDFGGLIKPASFFEQQTPSGFFVGLTHQEKTRVITGWNLPAPASRMLCSAPVLWIFVLHKLCRKFDVLLDIGMRRGIRHGYLCCHPRIGGNGPAWETGNGGGR